MVQAEDSIGGSHWIRNSSDGAGGPMKKSYDLEVAYYPDGSPGPFVDNVKKFAPVEMYMSR